MPGLLPILVLLAQVNATPAHSTVIDDDFDIPQPVRPNGLCHDLFSFTCAPGEYDDTTGKGITGDVIRKKVDDLEARYVPRFAEKFEKLLRDKSEATEFFRKNAWGVMGSGEHCADAVGAERVRCLKDVAKGLAELAARRAFRSAPSVTQGKHGSALGLSSLLTDNIYQRAEKEMIKEAREELVDKKIAEKIEKDTFPKVKKLVMGVIDEKVSDPKIRAALRAKVAAIEFRGTDCSEDSGDEKKKMSKDNSGSAVGLLVANAFYTSNYFRYCNGFALQNQSEFQIVHTIAHELAHAIDPCGIDKGSPSYTFQYSEGGTVADREKEFPFKGLLACLRSKESIGAIREKSGPTAAMTLGPNGEPQLSMGETKENTEMGDKASFCESDGLDGSSRVKDQITESFADWMGAEVLPKFMQQNHPHLSPKMSTVGYSNVFRGDCDNSQPTGSETKMFDVHPDAENRVNRLLICNPQIRAQMGCPPLSSKNITYCDGEHESPTSQKAPEEGAEQQ